MFRGILLLPSSCSYLPDCQVMHPRRQYPSLCQLLLESTLSDNTNMPFVLKMCAHKTFIFRRLLLFTALTFAFWMWKLFEVMIQAHESGCLSLGHGTANKCKMSSLDGCISERVRQSGLPCTQRTQLKLRLNVHFHLWTAADGGVSYRL
jgi:hypothetical protein